MTDGELLASKAIEAATSEKAQGLIKGLFGKAFEETGEMIADQVRLRRFKNQIKIFEKAQLFLKNGNIDPQKINLKVLAPLIEFSSYEENEDLQNRWANLIKNIVSRPMPIILQQNAIEILNKISNEEATLLDYIYQKLIHEQKERADKYNSNKGRDKAARLPESFSIDWFSFYINQIARDLKQSKEDIETQVSNLAALGTLRYEIEVKVGSVVISDDSYPDDAEVDVTDNENIRITKLGFLFVELCH